MILSHKNLKDLGFTFASSTFSKEFFLYDKDKNKIETLDLRPFDIEEIEPYTFYRYIAIRKLILPPSLKIICSHAFATCQDLEKIVFNDNLEYIGTSAFENCALSSIETPKNLRTIKEAAFSRNFITKVVLNEGLERIEHDAFIFNALEEIVIPSTVKFLGNTFISFQRIEDCVRVYVPKHLKNDYYPDVRVMDYDLDKYLENISSISSLKQINNIYKCIER